MRGRNPTPGPLRAVRGTNKNNPGRENRQAPKPDETLGPPPSYLPKYQQTVWEEEAARCWWATEADRGAFEILIRNVARSRKLAKELEKEPAMVQGSRGKVRNPKSYQQRECEAMAAKMYAAFGLDPSSRTRVKVPEKRKPSPADEWRYPSG
jgi:P27 family predicted phage terminase small subunit